jgi:DNA invertase Pin-like site-specific DNA recombinase
MKPKLREGAHVALCYVRKSYVRKDKAADQVSPTRQRDMIETLCRARGWTPEFYIDAEGHRSGTTEQREQWQALKARLHDPDVAALVAYDLSRLHRKGYRIGALLDECDREGIAVVMAAPHQQIDFSTPVGKMIAAIIGIMDELYAADISQRSTAAAQYRKAQGKSIGRPPFGTSRNQEGYLTPSREGAWLLPGGSLVAGKADEPPSAPALWRGYYDCAQRILDHYASGLYGSARIAQMLNADGWRWRADDGRPVTLREADIRRVVGNWAEYGGAVLAQGAQRRHASDIDERVVNLSRAVFPVELLRQVAAVHRRRAHGRLPDRGRSLTSYPYPLVGLMFCARCDETRSGAARRSTRSAIGGRDGGKRYPRYRHVGPCSCGSKSVSVPTRVLESEFVALLEALAFDADLIDLLKAAARAAQPSASDSERRSSTEARAASIALCNRRIRAAVTLFRDGRMDEADYRQRVASNERRMAELEAQMEGEAQAELRLEQVITTIANVRRLWAVANDADRQSLARALFEELHIDLDSRRITGFRLLPWAEGYLIARASLLPASQSIGTDMVLGSPRTMSVPTIEEATQRVLRFARAHRVPPSPAQQPHPVRNEAIRAAHANGVSMTALSALYGLSYPRIWYIVRRDGH